MKSNYQSNGPVYASGEPAPPDAYQQAYVAQPYSAQNAASPYQAPANQYQRPNAYNQEAPPLTTVVIQQHAQDSCNSCGGNLITDKRVSPMQICGCILLFFVFWPICWIPFVIDGCYDRVVVCSRCHRVVRRYNPQSDY